MNTSYKLSLTEKEIKAIQDYTGIMHAKINAITDLKYSKINTLMQKSWDMEMSTQELEMIIQKFVDLYSAIYKAGNREGRSRLFRGTSEAELSLMKNNKTVSNCISTSLEEDIAKNFIQYEGKPAILIIRKEQGIPSLYIEPYKEEDKRNEEEVLILPFSKVKTLEYINDWQGRAYYTITLEKGELEQIPEQELETLKAQLIEGYENYVEKITQCRNLEENIEYLNMKIREKGLDAKEKQSYHKQLNEKTSIFVDLRRNVNEYRKQFTRMLQGMCKQRELEIEKQKENEKEETKTQEKAKQEEKKKKLVAEISKLEEEVKFGRLNIIMTLQESITKMEATINDYQNIAEDLKIGYSMNLHFSTLENVEKIKRTLQEKDKEEIQKENREQEEQQNSEDIDNEKLEKRYQELLNEKQQLITIKQIMQNFSGYIQEHKEESFQEIKANLNTKVQEMIAQTTIESLRKEKQQVSQEKDSKLQRFLYGTSLREEKMANLAARMELIRKQSLAKNPTNSVKIMLANIYECSVQQLQRKIFTRDASNHTCN